MDAAALPMAEIEILLSTLGRLLKELPVSKIEEGFKATLTLAQRCHPLSTARQACIGFMSSWLTGRNLNGPQRVNSDLIKQWLLCLPKSLWELKGDHPETSRIIINTLLDFGRKAPASPAALSAFDSAQESLVPFFFTVIGLKKPKKILGPFHLLDDEIQKRAIDMVCYFSCPSIAMLRAIAGCCSNKSKVPASVSIYAVSAIHSVRLRMDSDAYIGFMLSILFDEHTDPSLQAHVAACLVNLRAGANLGKLVSPFMERILKQERTPQETLVGLSRCAHACTQSALRIDADPFSDSLLPWIPTLLRKVFWGLKPETELSLKKNQKMLSVITATISSLPSLWPALMENVSQVVSNPDQAGESALALASLVSELSLQSPTVLIQYSAQTMAVVNVIEEIAGNTPNAGAHAARLRALATYHGGGPQ